MWLPGAYSILKSSIAICQPPCKRILGSPNKTVLDMRQGVSCTDASSLGGVGGELFVLGGIAKWVQL